MAGPHVVFNGFCNHTLEVAFTWAFRHPRRVDRVFGIYPATIRPADWNSFSNNTTFGGGP